MSLVEIAWICAVLKAPTTALESAANCVELNAPICAVVSEVPTALSWSEVKAPIVLGGDGTQLGTVERADGRCWSDREGLRGGDRGDLRGAEAAGEGGDRPVESAPTWAVVRRRPRWRPTPWSDRW